MLKGFQRLWGGSVIFASEIWLQNLRLRAVGLFLKSSARTGKFKLCKIKKETRLRSLPVNDVASGNRVFMSHARKRKEETRDMG